MTLTVKDHGFWTLYRPAKPPPGLEGAMFCHRETDGADWYEYRNRLTANTVKMTVMKMGPRPRHIVQAVSRDVSLLFPQNSLVLEVTGIADADPFAAYNQRGYDPERQAFLDFNPPYQVSDRKFFQALAERGVISEDEAVAAVARGELPPELQGFLASIKDKRAQFAARMMLAGNTLIERDHPTIIALFAALGMSEAEADDLFRFTAKL